MSRFNLIILGVALVFGLIRWTLFTVDEREVAVQERLGKIIRSDFSPGLYAKVPGIDTIRKFDRRILSLDTQPERYLTNEKKNVVVDVFVRWRINPSDPDAARKFYTSMGGNIGQANIRLDQILKDGLRSEIGRRSLQDTVSGERQQIVGALASGANRQANDFGIEIVDVRIKRVDLPEEVSDSVYKRMRAERERVARDFRSRGAEAAERIRADADRQREVILAEAYRDAELMRGEGDAKATESYALTFGKNPEFYSFYRSLNSYKQALGKPGDTLVLAPDAAYFRYFNPASIHPPQAAGAGPETAAPPLQSPANANKP